MRTIYLAGPEVFDLNAIEIGKEAVQLCKDYGFEGLYPLDNVVDFNQPKEDISTDIFDANIEMIENADIIVANLNSWRGKEPDSGTVWECGYASGLGKTVYGYIDSDKTYIEKFKENEISRTEGIFTLDNDSKVIEDFNGKTNLMIERSVSEIIIGNLEDVLKKLNED